MYLQRFCIIVSEDGYFLGARLQVWEYWHLHSFRVKKKRCLGSRKSCPARQALCFVLQEKKWWQVIRNLKARIRVAFFPRGWCDSFIFFELIPMSVELELGRNCDGATWTASALWQIKEAHLFYSTSTEVGSLLLQRSSFSHILQARHGTRTRKFAFSSFVTVSRCDCESF